MPDEPIPPPSDINVPPPDYLLAGKLQAEGTKDSGLPRSRGPCPEANKEKLKSDKEKRMKAWLRNVAAVTGGPVLLAQLGSSA